MSATETSTVLEDLAEDLDLSADVASLLLAEDVSVRDICTSPRQKVDRGPWKVMPACRI